MTEFKGYRPAPTVEEFVAAYKAKTEAGVPITDTAEIQQEEFTDGEIKVYDYELTRERARRSAKRIVDMEEFGSAEPLTFRSALDVVEEKPIAPVVAGTLWPGCLTVLAAESGAGKTFVSLNLAAHVDAGLPWFGRKVQVGPVCYISWEGDALNLRLRALAEARLPLSQFHVLRMSEPLSPAVDRFGGSEAPGVGEDQLTTALDALEGSSLCWL